MPFRSSLEIILNLIFNQVLDQFKMGVRLNYLLLDVSPDHTFEWSNVTYLERKLVNSNIFVLHSNIYISIQSKDPFFYKINLFLKKTLPKSHTSL